MMTSRRKTLHFEDVYLSQETLFHCHVSQTTALLMMMDSSVNERENEVCFIEDVQRAL